MNHRIQITVDDQLNQTIKARAKQMGLSVSSYARLVLMNILPRKKGKLLDQAIDDINSNNVEGLTLAEFNQQLDEL